jgi:hypothetical protein
MLFTCWYRLAREGKRPKIIQSTDEAKKELKSSRGEEKMQKKKGSGYTRIGLQRLDEWSILGMNHGHLW